MNLAYYKELRRKELIKNIIFITFILLLAVVSTFCIYHKFVDTRDEILKSNSIEVDFHSQGSNKFSITKYEPVSDNVGLSSKAHRFTIKNNTNKKVRYIIRLNKDQNTISVDKCSAYQIPSNLIKVAIHKQNEVSDVYNLDDFENQNLIESELEALEEVTYTVRFWISKSSLIFNEYNNYHYHGLFQVEEKIS